MSEIQDREIVKSGTLIRVILLLSLLCIFLAASCGNKEDKQDTLVIATAANMRFAMVELTKEFTKDTGMACDLIISSTGKLTAQIVEGAPYDLLVAADMKYPRALIKEGKAASAPKVYAYGKLVLWTLYDEVNPTLDSLISQDIIRIAIANPKTAPYGLAAEEVLKSKDLWEQIKDKLVFGESISQTNQFIVSRAVQIGFTSLSVVNSREMRNTGRYSLIDPSLYSPIAQGVILVKHPGKQKESAVQFYDFLFSESAKKILRNFGYEVIEN